MIGQKVNNYEIKSLIGEGGMGSVYLAEHPVIQRQVAIKFLRRELSENKELVARFFNEARAASSIRNRSMVAIMDLGTLPEGIPYMVMEYLPGENLAQRLTRCGKFTAAEALPFVIQVAEALKAAHAKDIIHRDLKPENLFLTSDDEGANIVVKVLDFGIAKLHGDFGSDSVKTKTGAIMGTPYYMAPEQCRGLSDEIDARTDVYALGTILYEMLCGRPPFVSPGLGDVLIKHVTELPLDPRELCGDLPDHVVAAMGRALQKSKENRFVSMAAFAQALRNPAAALVGPEAKWAAASDEPALLSPPRQATTGGTRLLSERRDSAAGQTRVLVEANPVPTRDTNTTLGAAAGERSPKQASSRGTPRAVIYLLALMMLVTAVYVALKAPAGVKVTERPHAVPLSSVAQPASEPSPAAAPREPSLVERAAPPSKETPPTGPREERAAASITVTPDPKPLRPLRPKKVISREEKPTSTPAPSAATPPPKKGFQPEMW